jgi:hypothetical protein
MVVSDLDLQASQKELIVEAGELVKIFSSIVVKSTQKLILQTVEICDLIIGI